MSQIRPKTALESFVIGIFIICSGNAYSQQNSLEETPSFKKRNIFQYISYKPAPAKSGKDGKDRIFVIQLFKGPKSGKAGKDGSNAPDLNIRVTSLKLGDSAILQVQVVKSNNQADTFYLNPRFGQLKISSDGGDGGAGGKGESGGGSDGSNGKGGNGGKIEVTFSLESLEYVKCNCLLFSNEGGLGAFSGYDDANQGARGKQGPPIYFKDESGKILMIR